MRGYLSNLTSRVLGQGSPIKPRSASPFESGGGAIRAIQQTPMVGKATGDAAGQSSPHSESGRDLQPTTSARTRDSSQQDPSVNHRASSGELLVQTDPGTRHPFERTQSFENDETGHDAHPSAGSVRTSGRDSAGRSVEQQTPASEQHVERNRKERSHDSKSQPTERADAKTIQHASISENVLVRQPLNTSSVRDKAHGPQTPKSVPDTVHIHIGRVEVRAQFPQPVAPPRTPSARANKTVSLEDYLKSGTGGGR